MQASKLFEYTQYGSVVRQVCLSAELSNPRHAVLLSSGQFVVSLKDSICLVGADGRRVPSNKTSTPAGDSRYTNACSSQNGIETIDRRGNKLRKLRPVVWLKFYVL